MFAYCGNNPVSRMDEDGEFWHVVIGGAVGAAIGFVSSVASDVIRGEKVDWAGAAISAGTGALTGALTAAGVPLGAMIAINASVSAVESVTKDLINNVTGKSDKSTGDIIADATISAGLSAFFTFAGGASNAKEMNRMYNNSKAASKALKTIKLPPKAKVMYSNQISLYKSSLGRMAKNSLGDLGMSGVSVLSNVLVKGTYHNYMGMARNVG